MSRTDPVQTEQTRPAPLARQQEPSPPLGRARPASAGRRIAAQAAYETRTMLRNGEQLLLLLILPIMALFALTWADLLDGLLPAGASRLDLAVPGVLTLCVISNAFSGQGIQTGFDRRYGVLRQLSTTPLGRTGLIAGKLGAILAVLLVQVVLIAAIALALGWRPDPGRAAAGLLVLVLGAAVFTGLGLLIAGTLRAEATLAIVNLVWVLLAAAGGTLAPVAAMPGALSTLVGLLPSAALGEAMRIVLLGSGQWPLGVELGILAVWGLLSWIALSRLFRWS